MWQLKHDDEYMEIKYYNQLIYEQNHFMINQELRLALFNTQFIALGASVRNSNNEYFASFLIFSYPNSTDDSIDLIDELFNKNEDIINFSLNLEKYTKIENNLFGYSFSGIKIINLPNTIILKSTTKNTQIKKDSVLSKNENLKIESENYIYRGGEHIIEYALVVVENNDYSLSKQIFKNKEEKDVASKNDVYEGKVSYFNIKIQDDLTTFNCGNICSLCLYKNEAVCIICKYSFNIKGDEKICGEKKMTSSTIPNFSSTISSKTTVYSTYLTSSKISYYSSYIKPYLSSHTTILTNVSSSFNSLKPASTFIKSSQINTISSSFISHPSTNFINLTTNTIISSESIKPKNFEFLKENILEGGRLDEKMEEEQIEELHTILKEQLKDFNNTNIIIETKNVIFQISTLAEQKNNDFSNISSIELGECEKTIILQNDNLTENDQLIIIKTDIKDEEIQSTYVQFEVYNPKTFEEIDLSICKNQIKINVPVYLSEDVEDTNKELQEKGYDIFNPKNSFYNDICSKYSGKNGADMTLNDRRNEIYGLINNISLCQTGCDFEYYNSTTKKAKCNCDRPEKNDFISDLKEIKNNFFRKENLKNIFSKALTSSNFMILKCYELALSFRDHLSNYGCMIITIVFLFFIIFMIKYFVKDKKYINVYIMTIINKCLLSEESHSINKMQASKTISQKLKKKYRKGKKTLKTK